MQSESPQSAKKQPDPAARLLQRAAGLYGRGDLRGAEEACRELLQLRPGQADALHILGLAAWRRGERDLALEETRKAITSERRKPQPHNSLGVMLKELGDLAGAEAAFRTAIELLPHYPDALTNLGNILSETGRLVDAESMHRRVVALAPNHADAHNNLATTLSKQERWEEAVAECQIAVELQPARLDFQINLGGVLCALEDWSEAATVLRRSVTRAPENADARAMFGIALHNLGESQQAAAAHRVATELRPERASNWANLAAAQVDLDDPDAALSSCRRALVLDPDLPEAHNSMGLAFAAKHMPEAAIAAFEIAIRLRPDYYKAYSNLGTVLQAQGRFAEALAAYATAVELNPDHAESQWNKGTLHLLLGELEPGWRGYEYGLKMKFGRGRYRSHRHSLWQGTAIAGKTIIVSGEQGIGDQIMFASVLSDMVERGAVCLVMLDNRLYPLLRRSIDGLELLPSEDFGQFQMGHLIADFQAPIGTLCRWLRPDWASFRSRSAYLKADMTKTEMLRRRYRARFGDKRIIGISWRGGSKETARIRSIPITEWSPILKQSSFGFVNLQYGDSCADLAAAQSELGVEILHDETVDPLKDLDNFASQLAAMDLVISIDNSTVHLAGALGVTAWVLLPAVPDWRWMLGRADSPWYSSVRLFRQLRAGEWSPVIERVAQEMGRAFGAASSDCPAGDRTDPGAPR